MRKLFNICCSLILLGLSAMALAAPVDINTADAATLAKAMNGVGAKRAEAIIAYRKEHGPFKSVDELTQVKGVNLKIVEENRANIVAVKH